MKGRFGCKNLSDRKVCWSSMDDSVVAWSEPCIIHSPVLSAHYLSWFSVIQLI